jgi:hypothetical protein
MLATLALALNVCSLHMQVQLATAGELESLLARVGRIAEAVGST